MTGLDAVEGAMPLPHRPFTLRDAMALVAATAIGLAITRGLYDPFWSMTDMSVEAGSFHAISLEVARWIAIALPMAWAWTIALLLLGLRKSQVGLRTQFSLPGSAACGAAMISIAIGAANLLGIATAIAIKDRKTRTWDVGELLSEIFLELDSPGFGSPGIAVTIAWVGLVVGGRWRSEPSWIDRAGRLMGFGWIILMILHPWIVLILRGAWT